MCCAEDERQSGRAGRDRRRALRCVVAALLLAAVGMLAGCTHVVVHRTPCYDDGPTQLAPPNGDLEAGTGVWIVGNEDSYVHVLAPGVNTYVLGQDVVSQGEWRKMQRKAKEEDNTDENVIVVEPGESVSEQQKK